MEGVTSRVGDIDFLKVAHHGSKGGLTDEQLTRLAPEIALISVGSRQQVRASQRRDAAHAE